ncbi:het domain protein [Colletotrichum kahawae]|uniref:Het domain protein n=1 Tax=Colletotrichum kahawae TaxID=34407 RepID=A0AAE0D9F9_COLKA|nr:het domain protein [Colletotrichum kahawae]
MKLLNCSSLEIEEYYGSSIPEKYAILSHTWESGEASFQDASNTEAMASKPGWGKIKQTCRLALNQGYSHAWVDTCCIDKTNFTELTEAINSMFKWYARSTICYAYLADIGADEALHFQNSRWFTRGWTLQELIAPRQVEFYDQNWGFLGTRADLSSEIEKRTGIDRDFLANVTDAVEDILPDIPIARRMSWAADRTTTREEDIAYCLLGIFDVNMPLLYGEGPRAFMRLQEEIMKETHDTSILAWSHPKLATTGQIPQVYFGLLATSPSMFAYAKTLERAMEKASVQVCRNEYLMTNKGFQIEHEVFGAEHDWQEMFIELGCHLQDDDESGNLCISLRDQGDGILVRSSPYVQKPSPQLRQIKTRPHGPLLIRKHLNPRQSRMIQQGHGSISIFGHIPSSDPGVPCAQLQYIDASPRKLWDSDKCAFLTEGFSSFFAFVRFRIAMPANGLARRKVTSKSFALATWFQDGCLDQPVVCLTTPTKRSELFNAIVARDGDQWESLCRLYEPDKLSDKVWIEEEIAEQPRDLFDRIKSTLTRRWTFTAIPKVSTNMGVLRKHTITIKINVLQA